MSALGYPDFQRITQWFGAPLAQAAAATIGAGAIAVGPLDVRSFASVVVCVKPTGGTVTVTVTQLVPGGPAALATASSFVAADGNVIFEAFVLLAGEVSITFQGSTPGETLAYAIVPANTNTNAEVAALTQLGFQHNDALVANETAIDLEDAAPIGWTLVNDPANLRVKVTPTLRQNGAATGSLYRWDGAAWTPTANVIVDDTAAKITFAGDTDLYRDGADALASDDFIYSRRASAGLGGVGVRIVGDANVRWYASADGVHHWTDGTSGADLNLYRYFSLAPFLATDNQFFANRGGTAQIRLGNNSGVPTIWFGNASGDIGDTSLYRNAASSLTTPGQLIVGSQILIGSFTDPNGAPHVGFANSGGILATPTGGGCLFVDAGALKYRGSAGSVTVIAPA